MPSWFLFHRHHHFHHYSVQCTHDHHHCHCSVQCRAGCQLGKLLRAAQAFTDQACCSTVAMLHEANGEWSLTFTKSWHISGNHWIPSTWYQYQSIGIPLRSTFIITRPTPISTPANCWRLRNAPGQGSKCEDRGGCMFFYWPIMFLDATASPSTYPCQWVSESVSGSVIHSFRFGDSYRISELCKLVFIVCVFRFPCRLYFVINKAIRLTLTTWLRAPV